MPALRPRPFRRPGSAFGSAKTITRLPVRTSRPCSVATSPQRRPPDPKATSTYAFARAVSRDDLRAGAELLGLPLDRHIANVIEFMRGQADALGLRGSAAIRS